VKIQKPKAEPKFPPTVCAGLLSNGLTRISEKVENKIFYLAKKKIEKRWTTEFA
jgi:hypothetical protein